MICLLLEAVWITESAVFEAQFLDLLIHLVDEGLDVVLRRKLDWVHLLELVAEVDADAHQLLHLIGSDYRARRHGCTKRDSRRQHGDEEQMDTLFELLSGLPQVVLYYLHTFVFPKTMQFRELKLSASGQDLGGSALFPLRLGFSGTPSNLLPEELGACQFAEGVSAIISELQPPSLTEVCAPHDNDHSSLVICWSTG